MSEAANILEGLRPKDEGHFIPNVWYLVCLATRMFMGRLVPNRGRNGGSGVLEFSIAGGGVERVTSEDVLAAYFLTPEQKVIVLQRLLIAFQAQEDEPESAGTAAACPSPPAIEDVVPLVQTKLVTQVRLLVVPVMAQWNLPEMAIKLLTYLLERINIPVSEVELFSLFGWGDELSLKTKRERLRHQRCILKDRVPQGYGLLCFDPNHGSHTLTWIVTPDMGVAVQQVSSE